MAIITLFFFDFVIIELIHVRLLRFEEANTNSKNNHLINGKVGFHYHFPPIEEFESVLVLAEAEVSHQNLSLLIFRNGIISLLELHFFG